jgi:hypothetical protein
VSVAILKVAKTRRLGRYPAPDSRDRFYRLDQILHASALVEGKRVYKIAGPVVGRPGPFMKLGVRKRPWRLSRNLPLNQLQTSECVLHAVWARILMAPFMQPSDVSRKAMLRRYHRAQELDEWAGGATVAPYYEGTSGRAGAKVAVEEGYADGYAWSFDEPTDRGWVLNEGALCAGIPWFEGMWEPDSKGYIHPTGVFEGWHEIVVRWYYVDQDAYLILNSWGPGWKGKFRGRWWPGHALIDRQEYEYLRFGTDADAFSLVEKRQIIRTPAYRAKLLEKVYGW